MSKIEYPTLDLFIYNLIEQSGKIEVKINEVYENYWSNLPERLQQKDFSTEINHKDTQRLDFNGQIHYGNAWRYLFYCRHKIIWAYEQGRELKARLAKQLKQNLIDTDNTTLLKKGLGELKKDLQTNSKVLSSYIQNINLLPIQQNTLAVNLDNYEKQRQDYFPTEKFLVEFGQIARNKYQVQLEKDYLSLNPGLAILENMTSTIRGMVEIEQAQRDRNLNNTVAIAGVGLATSQLASAVIIAQKPPQQCTPSGTRKNGSPDLLSRGGNLTRAVLTAILCDKLIDV